MKPGLFTFPENINSIAVFNISTQDQKNISVEFMIGNTLPQDTMLNFAEISNQCTDELANYLQKEKYFLKVRNFRDSIYLFGPENNDKNVLFEKTRADLIVTLNDLDFKIVNFNKEGDMIVNQATLTWSVFNKNDSLSYLYNQRDTLIYDGQDLPYPFNLSKRLKHVVDNSSKFFGKAFGSKMIPSWIQVERMFYTSNNHEMMEAEKYARDNQWRSAAEIWSKKTKNKNEMIAAKATYNMALACEMEGQMDAAIDWLVQSFNLLPANTIHQGNCQRYISLLALRKKELEKLNKQIRINNS